MYCFHCGVKYITMTYSISLESGKQLTVTLFRNVQNVAEVRKLVIGGTLKCCILKPRYIVDPFQIAVAANKAAESDAENKMATKSVYTEILFNLSLSKNISQSLVKFGVSDGDSDVLVCVIDENTQDLEKILMNFKGEKCSIEKLDSLSDEKLIRKEYKISDVETKVSSLLGSVVSRIAAKDFVIL